MLKKFWNILKDIVNTKKNNINIPKLQLKLSLSFLITGILFFIFPIINNTYITVEIFPYISGISIAIWAISLGNKNSYKMIIEFIKLLFFVCFLCSSLNFCIANNDNLQNRYAIIHSIISAFEIFYCAYYLISKFISIFNYTKNIFNQIKEKLFNSVQTETTKLKSFIENITALLTSIVGLIVIIKTIVEPLINLFR